MTAHEMRSERTLTSQPDLEPAASTQILPETLKETRQVSLTRHTLVVLCLVLKHT